MPKIKITESTWKLLDTVRLEGETDSDVIKRVMEKALKKLEAES